ncbi:MAG: glycine C-acetyltransferase [Alphaproteobacteria bacterium]|nr:glycine C-acetyltransferase [Alphaproteobacteria bacterium]
MSQSFLDHVSSTLADIDQQGLTKPERIIVSRQGADIKVRRPDGRVTDAINFCANNYLGLAGDERIARAAQAATEQWGGGLSSVRFICGTQAIHKDLEQAIARYTGHEDSILFAACFDANGAVFEPLFGEEDAIISDSLNHASIIDGVRLCKAKRYRYANSDMNDLETQLKTARADKARHIIIVTDGVFSMDGYIAKLPEITALANKYDALVMVDDCHATGHIGAGGRGTAALHQVEGRIDILTGTFGKTLGGSMGGFIAARREVIALLRQRARPYLFSNALAPAICGASLEAIRIAQSEEGDKLRAQLQANTKRFREGMQAAGFEVLPGVSPIVPVMLGDARLAQQLAAQLLDAGIYVTGFSFPVVPRGLARIRTQLSAAHSFAHVDKAIAAFTQAYQQVKAA